MIYLNFDSVITMSDMSDHLLVLELSIPVSEINLPAKHMRLLHTLPA